MHVIPPLMLIGVFLLVGYAAHALGTKLGFPRVSLLLLIGLAAGPSCFNIIPLQLSAWFSDIAHLALAMVGFLLGGNFTAAEMKARGRIVIGISLAKTFLAALLVFAATFLLTGDLPMALLLAGIAPASAPAATLDVIHESKARGALSRTVLGIVAIDDAWGVILFSLLLVCADAITGKGHVHEEILRGLWDIGGALLAGVGTGLPMAWLTGRLKAGEPTLVEAAGFVFLCAGLAMFLEVSYLLACMAMGATVANRAKHHTRPFLEIEGASEPFLVIFFLLAGYNFDLAVLPPLGIIGISYIIARSLGFIVAGRLAAEYLNASQVIKKHVGWCLLPQAGVALGLALLAFERFPELGRTILPLVVGTTIIFEIIGPPVTRYQLQKAEEVHIDRERGSPEQRSPADRHG